jgi:hypothetical protein
MTQHRWNTTDGFEAMAGWDRPLRHFFFQVGKDCECVALEPEDPDEDYNCDKCGGEGQLWVYENLRDKSLFMGGMTLEQVQDRLQRYLTAWPAELVPNLTRDKANDVGNQITGYDPIGTVREDAVHMR